MFGPRHHIAANLWPTFGALTQIVARCKQHFGGGHRGLRGHDTQVLILSVLSGGYGDMIHNSSSYLSYLDLSGIERYCIAYHVPVIP